MASFRRNTRKVCNVANVHVRPNGPRDKRFRGRRPAGRLQDYGKPEDFVGGYGSPRWNGHARKVLVEDCLALDVDALARAGFFQKATASGTLVRGGNSLGFEVRVRTETFRSLALRYRVTRGERVDDVEDFLGLDARTRQKGRRWYFRCRCSRRVGKVYLPPGAVRFACRECHGLTYRSRQRHDKTRDRYLRLAARDPEAIFSAALTGNLRAISTLFDLEKAATT